MINRGLYRLLVSSMDAFVAGRRFITNREKLIHGLIQNAIDKSTVSSPSEWRNVRQTILNHELNGKHYTPNNIDALILGFCTATKSYELGLTYLQFLKEENIKPNLATIGKYFKLLYHRNEKRYFIDREIDPKDQENILECYHDLRSDNPILDSLTLENMILGVSMTCQWKKCFDLLEEIKVSAVANNISYSAIVAAAFLNNEEELAWGILNEIFERDRTPRSIIFLTYLSNITKMKNKNLSLEKLEKLFTFFHEKDFRCDEEVAETILRLDQELNIHTSFTQVNNVPIVHKYCVNMLVKLVDFLNSDCESRLVTYKGICRNCHIKLNNYEVGQEEFNDLKNKLLKNVIVGKDVFVKTNPEELVRFHNFVDDMGSFDVVLDGLNIAYSTGTKQPPQVLAAMVAAVVSYFVEQNKKVLVLGRIHMNRWPKRNWEYVTKTCSVFLIQNISQDDPYLLYCALHSGKDTIIVTRDLMRGHKFLLENSQDKILFSRWLAQRQFQLLRINEEGKPIFR